ncbi:GNAT family N-acetyltransferase [bacterium]|nr:GNAT family N-acetyltransferase [bacterium]
MNPKIEIVSIVTKEFDRIKPLWEEQKQYHVSISHNFADDRSRTLFEDRKKEIIEGSEKLRIDIAFDDQQLTDIGYCLSTIDSKNKGEIDSLYLKEEYRRQGLGKKLVQLALDWMSSNKVNKKSIYIIPENSEALCFYRNFGFSPRSIHLQQESINLQKA